MNNPLRFTIRRKLWGILLLFIIIMGLGTLTTYIGSLRISGYLDSSEVESLRHAVAVKSNLEAIEQLFNDAVAQKEPELLQAAEQKRLVFLSHLDDLTRIEAGQGHDYTSIRESFSEYFHAAMSAARLLLGDEQFGARLQENAERVKEVLPDLKLKLERIIDSHYKSFEHMITVSTDEARHVVGQEIQIALLIALSGFILFYKVISSIIEPIYKLLDTTKKLGSGKLAARTDVNTHDEIGDLARSFNDMAEALEKQNTSLEEQRSTLASLLAERKEMEREIVNSNKELREANKKLAAADMAKSEFLASMSHELRTPLNAMINFTDQVIEDWNDLRSDDGWFEEAREMLQRVLRSSRHLLDLINDLLDLARIESGKMFLYHELSDIGLIIEDCVISLESLARHKGIGLYCDLPEKVVEIVCDKRRVKQIILNLLGNAIKFTDKGEVRVMLREDAEEYPEGCVVDVVDTGIGIPEKYQKIIFDRFQQVDSSDSRKHTGTGLGLNLVKELTEMHGGHVKLSSEEGKGTIVSVCLPYKAVDSPISK